eukprot:RCo040967
MDSGEERWRGPRVGVEDPMSRPLVPRAPSSPSRTRSPSRTPAGRLSTSAYPPRAPVTDESTAISEELLQLEATFNRQLEQARRRDLDEKQLLRKKHTAEHIKTTEELKALSDMKAVALVDLFTERERELRAELQRVLDTERLRWEGMLAERD